MSPLASLDGKVTHPHLKILQKAWCYARVFIRKVTESWLLSNLEKMIPCVWACYFVDLKISVRSQSQVDLAQAVEFWIGRMIQWLGQFRGLFLFILQFCIFKISSYYLQIHHKECLVYKWDFSRHRSFFLHWITSTYNWSE